MYASLHLQGALVLLYLMAVSPQIVRYRYFDDYLMHLERREQSILIEEVEIKIANSLPIRTGSRFSKEEECCMLGQIAGEKGFHCVASFYASRIIYRNYNRAHNKKIAALLKGKPDPTANKLMRTFERCVANRGFIFHKCCRHATMREV